LYRRSPHLGFSVWRLALRWLVEGYGYEVTGADVRAAYSVTVEAATKTGKAAGARDQVRQLGSTEGPGGFVTGMLGRELGL